MNHPICRNCLRTAARQTQTRQTRPHNQPYFTKSSQPPTNPPPPTQNDPSSLLSTPTWSIRTLLTPPPNEQSTTPPPTLTPSQLTHLLRLSALPSPSTPTETQTILSTLHSQLLFVREIQKVDTTGVQPLASIRDESPQGLRESTITLDTLQPELANEESFGHCKRPRRRRDAPSAAENTSVVGELQDWDVLGTAEEKAGRYFVVRSRKGRED